jgi:hypothetical protein
MQDAGTKGKEGLAAWYLGSRIAGGAVFVVALLGLFSLLGLSKEFASAGASGAASLRTAGTVLWTAYDYAWMLGQSVFCVGAVMLIAGFSLVVTGDPNSTFSSVLYAPIGLQEMVLAVWLIARGFNPPIVA